MYYCDIDLYVGSYICVFDCDLLLYDVDEFIWNYYCIKYGYIEDMFVVIDV